MPTPVSFFFHSIALFLDKMFALYLKLRIINGYKFLMQNYHEGDRICLFGAFLFILDLKTI